MTAIPVLTFKLLIVSYLTAKRQSIHNRTVGRNIPLQSYDFIVVGAGTAGCIVAGRLSEDPNVNVLVLEAGGPPDAVYTDLFWYPSTIQEYRPDLQWQYYDEPQTNVGFQYPDRRINDFFGKSIGGSSSWNNIVYNRGNRRNFDIWAEKYGAVGWSYNDVMPYFLRYENNTDLNLVRKYPDYHSVGGPVQISTNADQPIFMRQLQQAFNQFDGGYRPTDFNGPNQTGTGFLQLFIDTHGFKVNSASAYIDPNPHPDNLHIIDRARVIRIIFNGTTAIGVEYDRNNIPTTVYAAKEVILSAGPYNSPQLLMLSGVGLRAHLQSFQIPVVMELPVGNNFMNHPLTPINGRIINPNYYFNSSPQFNIEQFSERYLNNEGPLGIVPVMDQVWSTPHNIRNFPNCLIGDLYTPDGRGYSVEALITQVRSRGTIRLQSSSPYIAPRIDPNYLGDPRDFQDMLDALRSRFYILERPEFNLSSIIEIPTFESVGCRSCTRKYRYECTEGLKCYINYATITSYHPGGSCMMGSINRDDVVVDPLLRVKNMYKLRVCDSSIFPEVPNVTPGAAVYMLGEKCAQIIKDCYHLA